MFGNFIIIGGIRLWGRVVLISLFIGMFGFMRVVLVVLLMDKMLFRLEMLIVVVLEEGCGWVEFVELWLMW